MQLMKNWQLRRLSVLIDSCKLAPISTVYHGDSIENEDCAAIRVFLLSAPVRRLSVASTLFCFSIVYDVVYNSPMYAMIVCVCTKTNIHGT